MYTYVCLCVYVCATAQGVILNGRFYSFLVQYEEYFNRRATETPPLLAASASAAFASSSSSSSSSSSPSSSSETPRPIGVLRATQAAAAATAFDPASASSSPGFSTSGALHIVISMQYVFPYRIGLALKVPCSY